MEEKVFIGIIYISYGWRSICTFPCHLKIGVLEYPAVTVSLHRACTGPWCPLWTIHPALPVRNFHRQASREALFFFGNLAVSMKKLLKSTSNTAIWHSFWTSAPFSHIISSGESFQSGSHEPVPFTVKVREMPSNLCDSLWYYKSVGCGDIFRCLLLGAEEKSLSCLQVRAINQEVNAAFVESRKYCRVKFFISSKSLINIYMSGISAHPSYSHNFLYFQ